MLYLSKLSSTCSSVAKYLSLLCLLSRLVSDVTIEVAELEKNPLNSPPVEQQPQDYLLSLNLRSITAKYEATERVVQELRLSVSEKDHQLGRLRKMLQQLKLAKSENRPTLSLATQELKLCKNATYYVSSDHPIGTYSVRVSIDETKSSVVQIPYDQILATGVEITPGSTVLAQHPFQGQVSVVPIEDFISYHVNHGKENPLLYKPEYKPVDTCTAPTQEPDSPPESSDSSDE